jgi:hypothetical protein
MRQYKVFIQASSFQRIHVEQCEHQGVHPSCAFVAKTITFPDETDPPEALLRAAEFAADVSEGEKMAVDLKVSGAKGRAVILASGDCTFNGKATRIRYLVGFSKPEKWWWLAINGASVAAAFGELTDPVVYPTPEQLIGYPTRKEQLRYQKYLLEAPIEDVTKYMKETVPVLIRQGQVAYRKPKRPQPPTHGPTAWTERSNLDEQENE